MAQTKLTIYGEAGRFSQEAIRLGVRLAENNTLLAVAMQYAWMQAWADCYRDTETALDAYREQQARTRRLIRRGVPAALAGQALRVV